MFKIMTRIERKWYGEMERFVRHKNMTYQI